LHNTSLDSGEIFFGGVYFLIFLNKACKANIEFALKGNLPKSIWWYITPRAQISTFTEYSGYSWSNSGAIYGYVPKAVVNLSLSLANPKSPILKTLSLMKILSGLRSLWAMLLAWIGHNPFKIWKIMIFASFSERIPFRSSRMSYNEPPPQYSSMI